MKYDPKRTIISGKYHSLDVYDCPIEVVSVLAEKVQADVTVENIRHSNDWSEAKQPIYPRAKAANYKFRRVRYDVALSNAEFIDHMKFWDSYGVYAAFTEKSPVVFKITDLQEPARYRALENFGFILEIAIGGPSSSGWSSFVSPNAELIDIAEKITQNS